MKKRRGHTTGAGDINATKLVVVASGDRRPEASSFFFPLAQGLVVVVSRQRSELATCFFFPLPSTGPRSNCLVRRHAHALRRRRRRRQAGRSSYINHPSSRSPRRRRRLSVSILLNSQSTIVELSLFLCSSLHSTAVSD